MNKLSIKQLQLLEAIQYFINKNGYSPTVEELCKLVGNKSKATVFDKLMKLEEKGYITSQNGKARTIRVIKNETIS